MNDCQEPGSLPFGVLVQSLGEVVRGAGVMGGMFVALTEVQQIDCVRVHRWSSLQYSEGSNRVVAERSASVMTHTFSPVVR